MDKLKFTTFTVQLRLPLKSDIASAAALDYKPKTEQAFFLSFLLASAAAWRYIVPGLNRHDDVLLVCIRI